MANCTFYSMCKNVLFAVQIYSAQQTEIPADFKL